MENLEKMHSDMNKMRCPDNLISAGVILKLPLLLLFMSLLNKYFLFIFVFRQLTFSSTQTDEVLTKDSDCQVLETKEVSCYLHRYVLFSDYNFIINLTTNFSYKE